VPRFGIGGGGRLFRGGVNFGKGGVRGGIGIGPFSLTGGVRGSKADWSGLWYVCGLAFIVSAVLYFIAFSIVYLVIAVLPFFVGLSVIATGVDLGDELSLAKRRIQFRGVRIPLFLSFRGTKPKKEHKLLSFLFLGVSALTFALGSAWLSNSSKSEQKDYSKGNGFFESLPGAPQNLMVLSRVLLVLHWVCLLVVGAKLVLYVVGKRSIRADLANSGTSRAFLRILIPASTVAIATLLRGWINDNFLTVRSVYRGGSSLIESASGRSTAFVVLSRFLVAIQWLCCAAIVSLLLVRVWQFIRFKIARGS
jgi:hypothetical protein